MIELENSPKQLPRNWEMWSPNLEQPYLHAGLGGQMLVWWAWWAHFYWYIQNFFPGELPFIAQEVTVLWTVCESPRGTWADLYSGQFTVILMTFTSHQDGRVSTSKATAFAHLMKEEANPREVKWFSKLDLSQKPPHKRFFRVFKRCSKWQNGGEVRSLI